ncbi:hypothetical protein BDQ12DRAFT_724650 [Crucibulum laeve]|uniref:Uncharacterized protein n=1 Tax=Crucibulum laeve TaxID=68775 RepID=A0A5C3M6S6_9AGAR|nr:hypothetical protein BDQ12DRAFT_724650 [Crucibulum laeve]
MHTRAVYTLVAPLPHPPSAPMPRSQASLDDLSSNASSYDSDEDYRLAEQEWQESLQQLQQLLSIVLLPFLGKWLGRRWSHWAYDRYMRVGLGKPFFFSTVSPTPRQ